MFSHEKLKVYQFSIAFVSETQKLTKLLPAGNSDLINQLKRAAMSIPLNIAEGVGKVGIPDKKRFFGIARGSAFECCAIFDVMKVYEIIAPEYLTKARELLQNIIPILSTLSR